MTGKHGQMSARSMVMPGGVLDTLRHHADRLASDALIAPLLA